jgi:arginine decarboxylase
MKQLVETELPPSKNVLDFYHSPTQLRFDTWHQLDDLASRLRRRHEKKTNLDALRAEAKSALSILQTIEDYTAFPSNDDFKILWGLFEQQDYIALKRVVSRIVWALSGEIYRRKHIDLSDPRGDSNEQKTRHRQNEDELINKH